MSSTSINMTGAAANTTAQSSDPEVTVRGRCFPRGGWSFDTNRTDDTVLLERSDSPNVDIVTGQNDYTLPPPLRRVSPIPKYGISPPRYTPRQNVRPRDVNVEVNESGNVRLAPRHLSNSTPSLHDPDHQPPTLHDRIFQPTATELRNMNQVEDRLRQETGMHFDHMRNRLRQEINFQTDDAIDRFANEFQEFEANVTRSVHGLQNQLRDEIREVRNLRRTFMAEILDTVRSDMDNVIQRALDRRDNIENARDQPSPIHVTPQFHDLPNVRVNNDRIRVPRPSSSHSIVQQQVAPVLSSHANERPISTSSNRLEDAVGFRPISTPNRPSHTIQSTVHPSKMVFPEKYKGDSSWNDYLLHFEMCAEINHWGEEDKARYLAISLRGQAQRMFGNLSANARTNYRILVQKLEERFGTEGQSELFMSKLLTKTKGNKESYQELADNIGNLVSKAYPTASDYMIKILTLQNFIDAIPDVELRTKIKLAKFKDVREAVMLACEIEAINQTEGVRTKVKRPAVQQTRVDSSTDTSVRKNKATNNERKDQSSSVKKGEVSQLTDALSGLSNKLSDMQQRMNQIARQVEPNMHRNLQPNFQQNFPYHGQMAPPYPPYPPHSNVRYNGPNNQNRPPPMQNGPPPRMAPPHHQNHTRNPGDNSQGPPRNQGN